MSILISQSIAALGRVWKDLTSYIFSLGVPDCRAVHSHALTMPSGSLAFYHAHLTWVRIIRVILYAFLFVVETKTVALSQVHPSKTIYVFVFTSWPRAIDAPVVQARISSSPPNLLRHLIPGTVPHTPSSSGPAHQMVR